MKLSKTLKALALSAVVCVNSITALTTEAWSTSYELDYTICEQQKSNWCWAACAETMAKLDVPTTTLNQAHAVCLIFGTTQTPYPNATGDIVDVETAAEYIAHNQIDYTAKTFISTSEAHIYQIINGHTEVFCVNGDDGAHALTLKAIYMTDDSTKFIRIADPYNGREATMPYASFISTGYEERTPIAQCSFTAYN